MRSLSEQNIVLLFSFNFSNCGVSLLIQDATQVEKNRELSPNLLVGLATLVAVCSTSSGSGTATTNITEITNIVISCIRSLMGGAVQRTLSLTSAVTVFAGSANGTTTAGDLDGNGTAARFNGSFAITADGTNLYVADTNNHKIRRIVIATGAVTVLAGPAAGTTTAGDLDGTGTAARFNAPLGITTDGTNLYVADTGNRKIRRIVIATGAVTVLAGSANGTTTPGDLDGTGNAARFKSPVGITTDGTGLYVTEINNNKIRRIQ